jgi:hypothetical protein
MAQGELHDAAQRLADAWRGMGATVVVDKTRFLNDDETVPLLLPKLPGDEADANSCVTVVLLGARGLGFHAALEVEKGDGDAHGEERDEASGARTASEAGALSVERCGDSQLRHLKRLLVTTESGRGALETVVARSTKPLKAFRSILPERGGGVAIAPAEPGVLPPMPPPNRRAEVAEARAKRDGATIAPRWTWQAGPDGSGRAEEILAAGCHTLELYALDPRASNPARHGKLDLDAEMRDPSSGDRILARDRSDAPDAQLAVCLGETTQVEVAFAGSPPGGPVLVTHLAWPLPEHLPAIWGDEAVARMAHVLLTRHVGSLLRDPVMLAQGGSGTTAIPISIEPGACYLALVSVVQGATRAIGLRVHVGLRDAFDDRGVDENGAVVGFCAGERSRGVAEVEARGTPLLGWGMALYRLGTGIWEIPR